MITADKKSYFEDNNIMIIMQHLKNLYGLRVCYEL